MRGPQETHTTSRPSGRLPEPGRGAARSRRPIRSAPVTARPLASLGFKVVRVDMKHREVVDFAVNKIAGPASKLPHHGFERPSHSVFGHRRSALCRRRWRDQDRTREGRDADARGRRCRMANPAHHGRAWRPSSHSDVLCQSRRMAGTRRAPTSPASRARWRTSWWRHGARWWARPRVRRRPPPGRRARPRTIGRWQGRHRAEHVDRPASGRPPSPIRGSACRSRGSRHLVTFDHVLMMMT